MPCRLCNKIEHLPTIDLCRCHDRRHRDDDHGVKSSSGKKTKGKMSTPSVADLAAALARVTAAENETKSQKKLLLKNLIAENKKKKKMKKLTKKNAAAGAAAAVVVDDDDDDDMLVGVVDRNDYGGDDDDEEEERRRDHCGCRKRKRRCCPRKPCKCKKPKRRCVCFDVLIIDQRGPCPSPTDPRACGCRALSIALIELLENPFPTAAEVAAVVAQASQYVACRGPDAVGDEDVIHLSEWISYNTVLPPPPFDFANRAYAAVALFWLRRACRRGPYGGDDGNDDGIDE